MRNNKGVTLIIVIMTILLLAIMAGLIVVNSTDTYKNSKVVQFEINMKSIQKKVDLILEENNNYIELYITMIRRPDYGLHIRLL